MMEIKKPRINSSGLKGDVSEIKKYLYKLAEDLQYVVTQLEAEICDLKKQNKALREQIASTQVASVEETTLEAYSEEEITTEGEETNVDKQEEI